MSELLGIALSLIVAIFFGVSAVLQKDAVALITKKKRFSFRMLFKNMYFIVAMIIGGIGILAYMMALKIAPLSTVQVFLSISVIIPVFAGFLFFREKLKVIEWLCVILIITGVFLTVV